jgi:hypothetical protein
LVGRSIGACLAHIIYITSDSHTGTSKTKLRLACRMDVAPKNPI